MAEKKLKTQDSTRKTTTPKSKVEKKAVVKAEAVQGSLKITVLDVDGKTNGTMSLPEAIFGAKVNDTLMAQAVRVYLANQRLGTASVKTRGEVTGSTRKIYQQKGTGRARHGGIRAPIFVKGGVAHGPKPKDYSLSMPTKMKRAALFSALTVQLQQGNIAVVAGLEKVGPKTKNMAQALAKVGAGTPSASSGRSKVVVVLPKAMEEVYKAGRNIAGVTLSPANELSTYAVLGTKKIIFMKEAIDTLQEVFIKKGQK